MTDVELAGPFEARQIDLVVYDSGPQLGPAAAANAVRRERLSFTMPGTFSPTQRGVTLAERLEGRPEDLSGGWWIELDVISSSRLRERRTGLDLQLRMKDGAGATIGTVCASAERGLSIEDLRRASCPARMLKRAQLPHRHATGTAVPACQRCDNNTTRSSRGRGVRGLPPP